MVNNLDRAATIGDSISLELLTSNVKLPPLPANGEKLLTMTQQPVDEIDIMTFARLVEVDPGLFASVMQLANSPYYGGVEKIISLRAAITRIGLTEAINAISLYFFQKMLPEFPDVAGFSSRDYWAHSWACAIANRRLGHPNLEMDALPGELYIAGLLHGMGKMMMAIHYPDEFAKCVKMVKKYKKPLYKVEQDVFGTTDAFVASKMMEVWNIPEKICAGVAFYQMPESAPAEYRHIAGLTQLAYGIAAMSGIGSCGDGHFMDITSMYVCQQSDLKIFKKEIRDKVIHEISVTIGERAEEVTGMTSNPSNIESDVSKEVKQKKKSTESIPVNKTEKTGLFSRIIKFFGLT